MMLRMRAKSSDVAELQEPQEDFHSEVEAMRNITSAKESGLESLLAACEHIKPEITVTHDEIMELKRENF